MLRWIKGEGKLKGFEERCYCSRTKRRNSFDITLDVLQVCLKGSNKTRIVNAANLNSKRTNTYLLLCLHLKLLTKQSNGKSLVYHTTADGSRLLRNYLDSSHELYQK